MMKWPANSKQMENIFHTVCETDRLHTDKKLSRRNTRSVNDTSQKKGCSQPEKYFCFLLKQNSVIHTYYFLRRDLVNPLEGWGFCTHLLEAAQTSTRMRSRPRPSRKHAGDSRQLAPTPGPFTAPVNRPPYGFQCYLAILYHRERACRGPTTAQHYLLFRVWALQPHH